MASALVLCCLASAQAAEVEDAWSATTLTGESLPTLRRLEAADKLADQKKWAEAIDEYLQISTEAGDVLVPLEIPKRQRAVQARWLCHQRLAQLGTQNPTLLRLYRSRIEDRAKKWLQAGKQNRDSALLQRVVDQAFCSRSAEEALELLGDLACERGNFDEAQSWWRLLTRPASADQRPAKTDYRKAEILEFPDPQPERAARVRAKQIIVRLFQGERRFLARELKAFRDQHPKAAGELAGAKGNYADILERLLAGKQIASFQEGEDVWVTFGGRPSRNLLGAKRLHPRIAAEGPTWSVRLDTGEPVAAKDDRPASVANARSLAVHPIIAGNLVLWADAQFINAHDLRTGRRVYRFDLGKTIGGLGKLNLKLPAPPSLRYTLSVSGNRLFARLGRQGLAAEGGKERRDIRDDNSDSFLVCLDLQTGQPCKNWPVKPRVLETDPRFFEGAPLVHEGRVYAAVSRLEGIQTKSYVVCYDAASANPLWQQEVCETKTSKDLAKDNRRYEHHLLTLAGTKVVYCSHGGAIVALDALTGKRAWGVRYLSRGLQTADGDPSPRGLAPCVYAAGRLFAAPADSDRLFCLDAQSGRVVWERDHIEVVHLLGVAEGRLIFTRPEGIRAVVAASGTDEKDKGAWSQPSDGKLPPAGRGFLAAGWVYWPTASPDSPLLGLNVEDGSLEQGQDFFYPNQYRRIERGNMVYANGCLAVAGTEMLSVFVPEERFLKERRAAASRRDASALAFYRLALAEAGLDLCPEALAHFARAEQNGKAEKHQGVAVRDLARHGRHELLLQMARRENQEKQWTAAADLYRQAAGAEFPVSDRVRALARLAEMWQEARQPDRAVAAWQAILDDQRLRRGQVTGPGGNPVKCGSLARISIQELIRVHGPAVYEPFEKKAKLLLASALGDRSVDVLEQLTRQYPNASVTGSALLRLARLHEQAQHPVLAARAYRMLLGRAWTPPLTDENRAMARAGLARAYEDQGCWDMARETLQQLAAGAGDRIFAALDPQHTVKDYVARQLEKPEYRVAGIRPLPELNLPLVRVWPQSAADISKGGRLLVLEAGPVPTKARPIILLVHGTEPDIALSCRDAATGKSCWEGKLDHLPTWAACHGGTVLVAGSRAIVCIDRDRGKMLWRFRAPSPPLALVDPTRTGDLDLSAFRHTRTQLFFLQGERRLFALDAQTGRVAWSFWAPGGRARALLPAGRFNPFYHADDKWVVMQAGSGQWLAIDSPTGRLIHQSAASAAIWKGPPVAVADGRLCLPAGPGRVVLYDAATGKNVWTCRMAAQPDTTTLTGEMPWVFGDGRTVLVLVARNYGYQLERLDPHSGTPLWKGTPRIIREPVDTGRISWNGRTIYYASRAFFYGRSLADGKLLWSCPLPRRSAVWRTISCRDHVLAYPVEMKNAAPGLAFPVLVCDAKDGRLVQRLNFAGHGPQGSLQILRHGLAVEFGGQVWGLADGGVNTLGGATNQ
jgi:outer membrane protein assembly factor BamB